MNNEASDVLRKVRIDIMENLESTNNVEVDKENGKFIVKSKQPVINFKLDEDMANKFTEWNDDHKKTCKLFNNDSSIGGRLTFVFTPTGLGDLVVVKCGCGAEINLTNL